METVNRELKQWLDSPAMARVDQRSRYVHGVAFAAFVAAATLLKSHAADDLQGFRNFLEAHCAAAGTQVSDQVNVNLFNANMLSAWKIGVFGHTRSEYARFFLARKIRSSLHPPGIPDHPESEICPHCEMGGQWTSYYLYLDMGAILEAMSKHFAQQRKPMLLDRADLLAQMGQRPYWVPFKKELRGHKQRFAGHASASHCWCWDVDRHELGYQPVSAEDLLASRIKPDGSTRFASDEWIDPRKGDLFELIHALEKEQGEL